MNILVLTSVYKDESLGDSDTSTNIVNSFVKEWEKNGHSVVVIHNAHCYPRIIHAIPKKIKRLLANVLGFYIADYNCVQHKKFIDNGAIVYRLPIKKRPRHSPNNRQIEKQLSKIISILRENDFIPDIITGHWASPQMEIISSLKHLYKCKTAIVLHGLGYVNRTSFNAQRYLKNIDYVGARSLFQSMQIKELLHLSSLPFVCYSGIPDSYINNSKLNLTKFQNLKKIKFVYAGRLVSYKNVDVTINALSQLTNIDWEFNILGEGAARNSLEKLCVEKNCSEKVHFLGKRSRDEVLKILSESHVFIMVSSNEVFGLVYLEAMSASCITIATKHGGIDGIIIDGKNGFLCDDGDSKSLLEIIRFVVSNQTNALDIVSSAYNTAINYTDSNVAQDYLRNIVR